MSRKTKLILKKTSQFTWKSPEINSKPINSLNSTLGACIQIDAHTITINKNDHQCSKEEKK